MDISLLTGSIALASGETLRLRQVPGCPLVKAPAWRRIWTWSRFTLQALAAMRRHRGWPVLVVTNPPLVPWIAPLARRLFGTRYVILVYDIYPDVMTRMGMIRPGGLCDRILRRLSRRSLCRAEGVITIGQRMADVLRAHLKPQDQVRIEVIENWADTEFIRPLPKADNPFAQQHGLTDKLVVMYSGAFGATHGIENIVEAAGLCRDLPDVVFVLIGGGTRAQQIGELVRRKALPNLLMLPFQPLETLRHTFPSADCFVVTLDSQYAGISVPSKTNYALAAGCALLVVSPPETELTDLVAATGCGLCVRPGNPEELAQAVGRLAADRKLLEAQKQAARRAAQTRFDRARATSRYHECLRSVFGRGNAP